MIFQKTFRNLLMLVTVTLPIISLSSKSVLADSTFQISNQSGAQVLYLYVSKSKDKVWSSDFLQENVLDNGQEKAFSLSNSSCVDDIRYDIRAVLNTGNDVYGQDIDLCKNSNVIINSLSIQSGG